ncbi:MAG: hypothetical protein V1904_14170 [Bacteroidota bacterium]
MRYPKNEIIIFSIIAGILWFYIWLRAIYSPIVHDEAVSFYAYIQTGKFIPPGIFWDANNHILNSFFSYISYKLFGSSLLVLRLPNVLISLLFFIYIFRIAGFIKNPINRWVFLLASCFPHFIIEFFAYCRGYGISLAFITTSLYFLILYIKNLQSRNAFASILFAAFSVLANLTLINTYLLICGIISGVLFFKRKNVHKRSKIKTVSSLVFIALPSLILLSRYSLELKAKGLFYYGSDTGFISVTVNSLSKLLFRIHPDLLSILIICIFSIALMIFILSFIIKKIRKEQVLSDFIFPILLLGNIAATLIISVFMKVNYPEDRVGMYFYFFYTAFICFIADNKIIRNKIMRLFLFAPFSLVIVQFFFLISLSFSSYTPEYRIPFSFYKYLIRESKNKAYPVTVEAYQMHRFEWAYHVSKMNNKLNLLSYNNFPSADAEYVISDDNSFPEWREYYIPVINDEVSGLRLLKRIKNPELRFIAKKDSISIQDLCYDEYYNFLELKTDSLAGKSLYITLDITISGTTVPFQAYIMAAACDTINNNCKRESIDLDFLKPDWQSFNTGKLKKVLLINEIPENTNHILVFFCNKNKAGFKIQSGCVSIFAFDPPLKKNT